MIDLLSELDLPASLLLSSLSPSHVYTGRHGRKSETERERERDLFPEFTVMLLNFCFMVRKSQYTSPHVGGRYGEYI